jgi:hypothetical protein
MAAAKTPDWARPVSRCRGDYMVDGSATCRGARQPADYADEPLTPLMMDVTDAAQIECALEQVESLDTASTPRSR